MKKTPAFTLMELIMALSIMSLIGLAVAGASMVLSTSYTRSQEQYQNIQIARSVMRRLHAQIRTARLVTACRDDTIVLWANDKNGNGKINITEIVLVRFDSGAGEVREYRIVFPSEWTQEKKNLFNVVVSLDSVSTVDEAWETIASFGTYRVMLPLATDVSGFQLSASAAAPLATYVGVSVTVGQGKHSAMLRSAASLRKDETARVGTAGEDWVLMD